jgi:hypothetical protein
LLEGEIIDARPSIQTTTYGFFNLQQALSENGGNLTQLIPSAV